MKNCTFYLSALLFLFFSFALQAQNPNDGTVTVYSEEGENFTLYLNGEQKNSSPATRVVVDHVTEVHVAFRIVFENKSIPEVKKSGMRGGKYCTYSIHKSKKGEHWFRIRECQETIGEATDPQPSVAAAPGSSPVVATAAPAQLSATYANGKISINDGRTLTATKVKANGMTYPRVMMNAPANAQASITYDDNTEKYSSEVPFQYEVKDYSNNNSFFRLTVDEGGPEKTWHIRLQHANGYDLKID